MGQEKTFLIVGYFGASNFGDDWSLACFLSAIRNRSDSFEWIVISRSPDRTRSEFSVGSVPRLTVATLKSLRTCSGLIAVGGSLLQDTTSLRSLIYYSLIALIARRFRKKVILVGQGLGPLRRKVALYLASTVLRSATLVTFRDPASLSFARRLAGSMPSFHLSADLTFLDQPERTGGEKKNLLVVNLRPFAALTERRLKDLTETVVGQARRLKMTVVPLVLHDGQDEAPLSSFTNYAGIEIICPTGWQEKLSYLWRSQFVLSMRLHGLIAGLTGGSPVVGLAYDPKVSAVLKDALQDKLLPVSPAPASLAQVIARAMDEWKAGPPEAVNDFLSHQRHLAECGMELVQAAVGY